MTTFPRRQRPMFKSERHRALDLYTGDEFPERWMEPSRRAPMFAASKWPSRAIGVALAIAVGVLVWLLASGR